MPDTDPLSRSFGNAFVASRERERRIRHVFESVAPRYDLMNDLMSLGIHRLWKRRLVALAAPRAGQRIVDLAGGTGDVAARLAGADRQVTVIDPSEAMMAAGRARGLAHVRLAARRGRAAAAGRRVGRHADHRLRHPQRHPPRRGAGRGAARAQAGRPLPVPGVLDAAALAAAVLRPVLVHRDPAPGRLDRALAARPTTTSSNRSGAFPTRRAFARRIAGRRLRRRALARPQLRHRLHPCRHAAAGLTLRKLRLHPSFRQ